MPLLQNIRSLFSRKKPEESPPHTNETADPVSNEPSAAATPENQPQTDNVIYIYSHGFTNGVYRIEPDQDSFERFLEHCNHVDRIKGFRLLKEASISEAELKLTSAVAANAIYTAAAIEKEKLAGNVSQSISEQEQRRAKNEQKESALAIQAKDTVLEYSWLPALFYFSAGITFITADVSITKQITSWGFNMSGWQSWVFALGLAFTAFLIKPTVDRLLEKPFQTGGLKLRSLYKGVLLGITALGLLMLYCLGKFRSDSETARNKLDHITALMNTVEPGSIQSNALQAQYDEVQKSLDENSLGQTGLVLSGMLFAVGGAICLSISFGALKQLINRYWIIPIRIQRVKKETKGLTRYIISLRSEHTALKIEQEKAEKTTQTNEIGQLRQELEKLQQERLALLTEFFQAQHARESALYLDGKNKGSKYRIEGELTYEVRANDQSAHYLGKQVDKGDADPTQPARSYTRRPFVKLRKMIADNFNKNQPHQTYDGTEFEIIA